MILELTLFLIFMFIVIKSANYAITYSAMLSKIFRLSEFVFSIFIVAAIAVLPEAIISITSAAKGIPEFGLGTLLGSNVADLTLVFGIVALFSLNGIRIKSEILTKDLFYLGLLAFPLILGWDGSFSRAEGIILVLGGCFFFLNMSIESKMFRKKFRKLRERAVYKNITLLVLSLAFLIGAAHLAVDFGIKFANEIRMPPILIGLTMVSIGTCLPELFFSLKAVRTDHEELALGNILGTVITDATIIIGIIALIRPFSFDTTIIYITGSAMFLGGFLVTFFMRSGRVLARREGVILLMCYIFFLVVQLGISQIE